MPLAYHVILSAYGFWLPNDPRGSWSDYVGAWHLLRFGKATQIDTHRSVARRPHDSALRLAAKNALRFPPVVFNGRQANLIANAFSRCADGYGIRLFACCVLPEHTHLVITTGRIKTIGMAVNQLKMHATKSLKSAEMHPFQSLPPHASPPSMWTMKYWKVFLDTPADILRASDYVRRNPLKEGKKIQDWNFLQPLEP